MPFVTDTFTATGPTELAAYSTATEVGGPWVKNTNVGSGTFHVDTNEARCSLTPIAYYATATPTNADYDVQAEFVARSHMANISSGVVGRLTTSANTMYVARWNPGAATDGTGAWELVKYVSGTSTVLSTSSTENFGAAAGSGSGATRRVVKLQMRGTAIKVYVDGVQKCSATDSSIAAAGRAGIRGGAQSATTTTGIHLDTFSAVNGAEADSTPPANTVAPAVTGTASVGSTLTCTTGTWTGSSIAYTYQWKRDGSNISGATASTYTVVTGDAGHALTCTVTATNTGGTASATSNSTSIPAAPVNTVAPVVTTDGSPATGETITVDTGTWTGTGITYTYQWYRNTTLLTGQTANAYVLTVNDEGQSVRCDVTATNGGGTATASSNTITPAVTAPISDASFTFTLSGGPGNTDPALSIGGARGATYVGNLNELIGPILGTVAQAGGTYYRGVYIRNTHTLNSLTSGKLYLETQFGHAGMTASVAVPAEGVNTALPVLASGTTAPTGVTWTSTTTPSAGADFGTLGPGDYRGVWIRLVIAPSTTTVSESDATIAVQGTAT